MRNAAARYDGLQEHLATQMTRAQALRLRTLSEEAYQPKLFERDLTREEAVAYDVAAALNRAAPLPETIYRMGVDVFGRQGMAEIIYLVACFHIVAIILNGYDVSVPDEDHLDAGRSDMVQAA